MQHESRFAEVCILGALDKTLHYEIPPELRDRLKIGSYVVIPLRNRRTAGVVLNITARVPEPIASVKAICALNENLPPIPEDLISLVRWVSGYYFYPLGKTLQIILPPGARSLSRISQHGLSRKGVKHVKIISSPCNVLKKGKPNANRDLLLDLLRSSEKGSLPLRELRRHVASVDYWVRQLIKEGVLEVFESMEPHQIGWGQDIPVNFPSRLSDEQLRVIQAIKPTIDSPRFQPFLLHGVTGSGKTEVYLRLIEELLGKGRSALVLVPEIALSTQLEALFRHRFGSQLAVWHSGLPQAVRDEQWLRIAEGSSSVVLGVRSAVFSPLPRLGLIIVDEEHDQSYKQGERLRYNARDVALMRAKLLQIPVVLGSATPSVGSVYHVRKGHYRVVKLTKRIDNRPQPRLEIVDMKRERGEFRFISQKLQKALIQTVTSGHQALLFLNRRGFATFMLCNLCGQAIQCRHCSVSLTYHQKDNRLYCHYCGFKTPPPEDCPVCGNPTLVPFGIGTERVEEEVRRLLPEARIIRIDRDTASYPGSLVKMLNSVRAHRADVLIGTQMLAKGHDFPDITLVGVVNADVSLQIPDFRAGENTVQLLIQVAGRAGRGKEPGRVIIQTYNPQHYTIKAVLNMDYMSFCEHELISRRQLQYPPFTRFVKVLITAKEEGGVKEAAYKLSTLAREIIPAFKRSGRPLAVLGPAPAPISKLKDRFRWHLYIKGWNNSDIQEFMEVVLKRAGKDPLLRCTELGVDRDPVSNF